MIGNYVITTPTGTSVLAAPVVVLDSNGNVISGSLTGDATAANQVTQNTTLTTISTSIGSPITAATMPTGGVGLIGWLSAVWNLLTNKLPSLVNGSIPVVRQDYELSDIDSTNGYYGYVRFDGAWYIKYVTATSVRFISGVNATANYSTAWGGRLTNTGFTYLYLLTTI